MKIILHIGNGKSGSTSIQQNLFRSRDFLLEHGVLIPKFAEKFVRPNLLADALRSAGDLERNASLLQIITRQIEKFSPEIMILSSEYILPGYGSAISDPLEKNGRILETLREWSSDIEILVLYREPVSLYRSMLQQSFKGGHLLPDPFNWRTEYISGLTNWAELVGEHLHVLPFQKQSFFRESLVLEVLNRFCPNVPIDDPRIVEGAANVSECAEISEILQKYHLANYPSEVRAFRNDVSELTSTLAAVSAKLKIGSKATVKDEVAETILANHFSALTELKQNWCCEFSELDYDEISKYKANPELSSVQFFHEVCHVDPKVAELLELQTIRSVIERLKHIKE